MSWLVTVPAESWSAFSRAAVTGLQEILRELDTGAGPGLPIGRGRGLVVIVRDGIANFRRGRRRKKVIDGLEMDDEFIETYEFDLPDDEAVMFLRPVFAALRGDDDDVTRHWAHEAMWRVRSALDESAVERLARLAEGDDAVARIDL